MEDSLVADMTALTVDPASHFVANLKRIEDAKAAVWVCTDPDKYIHCAAKIIVFNALNKPWQTVCVYTSTPEIYVQLFQHLNGVVCGVARKARGMDFVVWRKGHLDYCTVCLRGWHTPPPDDAHFSIFLDDSDNNDDRFAVAAMKTRPSVLVANRAATLLDAPFVKELPRVESA